MKAAKSSSSSSGSIFSTIFTIVFFFMVISQGMSSGKSPVTSFQDSPVPAGGIEGGGISVQHQLTPSGSDLKVPGSESYNFGLPITNSYFPEKQPRDAGRKTKHAMACLWGRKKMRKCTLCFCLVFCCMSSS